MTMPKDFRSEFFQLSEEDGVAVVSLTKPRLSEEANLEQLDQEFNVLADTYHLRRIVVDLAMVVYLTSAAVGKLIALHRRLARNQGQLVLCSLQPEVSSVLAASHLLDYFKVAQTPEAALGQFS